MRLSPARPFLALFAALTSGLLSAEAVAQEILVCRHQPARIELYSAADGTLLNPAFVDIDAIQGLGGGLSNVWDVQRGPNNEIWVSNYSAQAVQRYSADGTMYLGDLATSAVASTGIGFDGSVLGIASTVGVNTYDTVAMTETSLSGTGGNWGVASLNGQWLVSRTNGTVVSIDPSNGMESPWANPGGFCEQIALLNNGQVLVANYGNQGYSVHDSTGALIQSYFTLGAGNVRGVAPLGNGNVMLSGPSGLYIFDPVAGSLVTVDSDAGAFIFGGAGGGGLLGTNYCAANANSTGSVGALTAQGSPVVGTNDVTLQASSLPPLSFGFFIAGQMQGFVPNPAGSSGNLCLAGSIGRFVGPGQIQQSDTQGTFALVIDLTSMPQPNGFVAVQAGETWNFQTWHRDSSGGQPTSNFTPGLEIAFQ